MVATATPPAVDKDAAQVVPEVPMGSRSAAFRIPISKDRQQVYDPRLGRRGRRRDEKVMISGALILLTNGVIAYNTWNLHQVLELSRARRPACFGLRFGTRLTHQEVFTKRRERCIAQVQSLMKISPEGARMHQEARMRYRRKSA